MSGVPAGNVLNTHDAAGIQKPDVKCMPLEAGERLPEARFSLAIKHKDSSHDTEVQGSRRAKVVPSASHRSQFAPSGASACSKLGSTVRYTKQ